LPPPPLSVLLDECIDWRYGRELEPHRVSTVSEQGWTGLKNGELLRKASGEFDVFITVDRNLSFQQNLPDYSLAVLVLTGPSNRLQDLVPHVPRILKALECPQPGTAVLI